MINELKSNFRRLLIIEAIKSQHYLDRLYDRFLNKNTVTVGYEIIGSVGEYKEVGSYSLSPEEKSEILNNAKKIENFSFPKNKSYGVRIGEIRINPNKVSFNDESLINEIKGKRLVVIDYKTNSNGDMIYGIIRNNEINTIYFAKSYIPQTKEKLNVDFIIKNIDTLIASRAPQQVKPETLDLPIIDVNNEKWYLDQPNNQFIFTNDLNKKINIDDAPIEFLEKAMEVINQ